MGVTLIRWRDCGCSGTGCRAVGMCSRFTSPKHSTGSVVTADIEGGVRGRQKPSFTSVTSVALKGSFPTAVDVAPRLHFACRGLQADVLRVAQSLGHRDGPMAPGPLRNARIMVK